MSAFFARKIKVRTAEGRWIRNPVRPSSCVTPAGTSNELDIQNKWEENTHNTASSLDHKQCCNIVIGKEKIHFTFYNKSTRAFYYVYKIVFP